MIKYSKKSTCLYIQKSNYVYSCMQKIKYKYLSMKRNLSIYIYRRRNAIGIDSVHIKSVLNNRLAHIIAFNSVLFSPFRPFNPGFFYHLNPFMLMDRLPPKQNN
jgi:hypothetical protein